LNTGIVVLTDPVTTTTSNDTTTTGVVTTTATAPTSCTVHVAVGTCITKNNKGEVIVRVQVLDYATHAPVEGAVVDWSVYDLDNQGNTVAIYPQTTLVDYGLGWHGGTSPCSLCDNSTVYIGCAASSESIYSDGNYKVEITISFPACGSGTFMVDPNVSP
jgi:hypothetical protein